MIPKVIHYCWFGKGEKPKLAKKCIESWKKYCPDYEIIEWNESNFDIGSCPIYVRQAYDAKKWAFVTDYVRLKVVYEHGGVYFDTDVQLLKKIDFLSKYCAWFGLEEGSSVNTGLGFGSEAHHPILMDIMQQYNDILFLKADGQYDLTPCPSRNTAIFYNYGLSDSDSKQVLDENILILPSIYLSPIDGRSGIRRYSRKTVSIHHFTASWCTDEQKKQFANTRKKERIYRIKHLPNKVLLNVLGTTKYEKFKSIFK